MLDNLFGAVRVGLLPGDDTPPEAMDESAMPYPCTADDAATLALQAGVHPKVVSERLGHATVSITLDTYSHAIPAMQEEAAQLIAGLVFASK